MVNENAAPNKQSHNKIIEAAHTLFINQGYHGTSMRQIATDAGISLGGIYNHFSGKEDVFHAVFLEHHPYHEFFPALVEAQGDTIDEYITDAANHLVQALNKRPDFINLMFIEIVEFKSKHAHELFANLFPQGAKVVQKITQKGGDKVRPIPVPMLMRTFLGMFFSYYLTEIIFSAQAPLPFRENAMEHFIDIYLHGILTADQ